MSRAAQSRYARTPKGRATQVRYKRSEKARATRLKKYGIAPSQYDAMLARQGGVCAICGRSPKSIRLAVEHDHATKRVRGLACFQCNKYRIGRNTAETAAVVLAYLRSDFDGRMI